MITLLLLLCVVAVLYVVVVYRTRKTYAPPYPHELSKGWWME